MKPFTTLLLALIGLTAAAQTVDSGIPKKEKQFTSYTGFSICPVAFSEWAYPGSDFVTDEQSEYGFFKTYRQPVFLWPSGYRYSCLFQNRLGIETGMNFSVEHDKVNLNYNHAVYGLEKSVNYLENFIQVPVQLVIYPYSKKGLKKHKALFFIKLGASFDFLVADLTETSSYEHTDPHSTYNNGANYVSQNESAGKNTYRFRFNRISPLFSIGETIKCSERMNINLNFLSVQYLPFYQKRNTVEYFTNVRWAFLCLGVNYKI